MEAIANLKEASGSDRAEIAAYIEVSASALCGMFEGFSVLPFQRSESLLFSLTKLSLSLFAHQTFVQSFSFLFHVIWLPVFE